MSWINLHALLRDYDEQKNVQAHQGYIKFSRKFFKEEKKKLLIKIS